MKYIRTKDGRILKVFQNNVSLYEENDGVAYYGKKTVDFETSYYFPKSHILNKADTIEELCDVVVYVKEGYDNHVEHIKDFQNRNKKLFDKDLIVYGAIWVEGEHNEPIIRSVAKMKGVLPNGKIDWELFYYD